MPRKKAAKKKAAKRKPKKEEPRSTPDVIEELLGAIKAYGYEFIARDECGNETENAAKVEEILIPLFQDDMNEGVAFCFGRDGAIYIDGGPIYLRDRARNPSRGFAMELMAEMTKGINDTFNRNIAIAKNSV